MVARGTRGAKLDSYIHDNGFASNSFVEEGKGWKSVGVMGKEPALRDPE
jgi:hypothetical protein